MTMRQGIALLRNAFPTSTLSILKEAATRCFDMDQTNNSARISTLIDLGCNPDHLLAPLSGLAQLFSQSIGPDWTCKMEHSWVRKKFPGHHIQDWHQDGALGVTFPPEPGPAIPMTRLLTCWIPLNPCGVDSPGLEFIRRQQPAILHFTELNDTSLRQRFKPEDFWVPELEFGDGLVFLDNILHRTHSRPEMPHYRQSLEYRIFPW